MASTEPTPSGDTGPISQVTKLLQEGLKDIKKGEEAGFEYLGHTFNKLDIKDIIQIPIDQIKDVDLSALSVEQAKDLIKEGIKNVSLGLKEAVEKSGEGIKHISEIKIKDLPISDIRGAVEALVAKIA